MQPTQPFCFRVISSLAPTEDFARQLSYDELVAFASSVPAERPVIVCSALADGVAALEGEVGKAPAAALVRELILLLRRNLRSTDAIALQGDELVLLLEAPRAMAERVAHRLLSAVRTHLFSGGVADRSIRLTLSVGLAAAPEQGTDFDALLSAAREARAFAGSDSSALASAARRRALDVARFVGRSEQLERLTHLLDDMVRGVGRVAAVTGETGIGTSALIHALEPQVRMRGGSLVTAQCRESTLAVPYALWRDVLRGIHRLSVKSTRLWRELPSLDPSLEHAIDDTPGVRSKVKLLEELADYLRLAAQQRPLTIHLEELQWVDAASWDALEYLIPQLESERVLLVLSFRTGGEGDDSFEPWTRLASRPRHQELRLTSLTRDDVKRWLEGAMHDGVVGRDLLAFVYRYTEGNPLLLGHLLRDLEESGHLSHEDGSWRWTPAVELRHTTSPGALIARRLERLPALARSVLEAASVLDRECDAALLARMLERDPAEIGPALDRLADAGLLTPTFERVRGAVTFTHGEVARVTRELLDAARRAVLHRRAAESLAEQPDVSSIEIAAHFDEAGCRAEAHQYALRGAEAALDVHENGAAAALLSLAERTAPSERAMAEVRGRMGWLAELVGRFEEAEALCDLALEWYESQGELSPALAVSGTRAMARMRRGQPARDTLSDLLAIDAAARRAELGPERARILLLISQTYFRLGDPHAARSVAEECVMMAEQGDDQGLLIDSCNRLALTIQLGEPAKARDLYRRALALSDGIGDYARRVRTLHNLGVLEILVNNWDEARSVLSTAVDEARTAGLTELWGRALLNSGVLAGRVGDYEDAVQLLSEALQVCASAQSSELQLYATYNLAHVERDRGRLREAGDTYELVMALAQRIGQAEVEDGACAGFGLCRLDAGALAEARRSAEQVAPFLAARADWFQGRELGEALLLHLSLRDGRHEQAVGQFLDAVTLAHPVDVFAAAWLTAEFSAQLRAYAPDAVRATVERYGSRPEVAGNPSMRAKFDVLIFDS